MDLYKNVIGDIDAMITFDKILGGFGQNTVNTTRERVQINSKHEKVEREIEGASPYLKSDYELFVEHHNMLMQEYRATQLHLRNILEKKNEVKSIQKLADLCERHQCSNIAQLFVEKNEDEYVLQCFQDFQQDLENNNALRKDFNHFSDSFEAYRYNMEICNKLSGIDQPFTLERPNDRQLNFVIHSHENINKTLLDYQAKIIEQQTTVDQLKQDASYTALFPIATNDKNMFSIAATEVYVEQSPKYQDYLKVIKNELKNINETGKNAFSQHYKDTITQSNLENVKTKDSASTYSNGF